jgi:hypothetical protein
MDNEKFDSLKGLMPDSVHHPHTFFWWGLMSKFAPDVRKKFPEQEHHETPTVSDKNKAKPSKKEAPKKEAPKKEAPKQETAKPAKKDDDFDPFADEMDDVSLVKKLTIL